ncbi:MAG: sigma-54 interaction domain-containing protein [bacterium]
MDIQTLKQRYDIIGNDPKLLLALNKAIQVAPTDLSILITGESGVGKDVFSRIIHENSNRKHVRQGRGLISVNCGAIPEGTIESELFGHVKGAFTGADRTRKGYFEEADGGTIFLDEIGELPLAMQVKLLRVLENGEIIPVGSSTAQKINVRVVAATNVDIVEAVRTGRFREDLYYRLNQISIYLPPLRERKEDIPLLFRKFSSDVAEKYHMPPIVLTENARSMLMNYPWYGNVRELKNITEQISVVETERSITPDILQNYLSFIPAERMPAIIPETGTPANASQITDRELLLKALTMGQMINEMRGEINELRQMVQQLATQPLYHPSSQMLSHPVSQPLGQEEEFVTPEIIEDEAISLEDRERRAILRALEHSQGNRKQAAADLHISERTLYRKLKEYNISE